MEIEELQGLYEINQSCTVRKDGHICEAQLSNNVYSWFEDKQNLRFYPEPPWKEALESPPFGLVQKVPWPAIHKMNRIIKTDFNEKNSHAALFHGQFIGFYPGLGVVKCDGVNLFVFHYEILNGGVIPVRALPLFENYWTGNVHVHGDWFVYPCNKALYLACNFPVDPLQIHKIMPGKDFIRVGDIDLKKLAQIEDPSYAVSNHDCWVHMVVGDGKLNFYERSKGTAGHRIGSIDIEGYNNKTYGFEQNINWRQLQRYATVAGGKVELAVVPDKPEMASAFMRETHLYLQMPYRNGG